MKFCLIVAFKAVTYSQSLVNWLRAMQFWLRAMSHSAEFFSPRIADELCAMQSNLSSIEHIFNKNSALCCIARGRLGAMLYSGESWLRAMQHSGKLWLCAMLHCTYSRIWNRIRKYFRGLGTIEFIKKSHETVSLSCWPSLLHGRNGNRY
jgi:hypothetical protein